MEHTFLSPSLYEDFEPEEDYLASTEGNVEPQFEENAGRIDEEVNTSTGSDLLGDADTEYTTLLVIYDEQEVGDNQTSEETQSHTEGIEHVIEDNCEILGVIGNDGAEENCEAEADFEGSEDVNEKYFIESSSKHKVKEEISIEDEADIYGEGPYTCNKCQTTFTKRSEHYKHLQMHFKECPFVCQVCNESFSQKCQLEEHLDNTHTEEKLHICKMCKQSFGKIKELNEHLRGHFRRSPLICNVCKKQFGDRKWLNKHLRVEHGEVYTCRNCYRSFCEKNKLLRHMSVHEAKCLFTCNVGFCNTSFRSRIPYERHLRMHGGDFPFVCDFCKIPFAHEGNYNKHILIHNK